MSPARAKYRRLHSDSGLQEEARPQLEAGEVRERSLQSVLSLAQQELELEESEHQVQCLAELSTILRKLSQCPEKASTWAFFWLEAPAYYHCETLRWLVDSSSVVFSVL